MKDDRRNSRVRVCHEKFPADRSLSSVLKYDEMYFLHIYAGIGYGKTLQLTRNPQDLWKNETGLRNCQESLLFASGYRSLHPDRLQMPVWHGLSFFLHGAGGARVIYPPQAMG